jgi:hypothetical protein
MRNASLSLFVALAAVGCFEYTEEAPPVAVDDGAGGGSEDGAGGAGEDGTGGGGPGDDGEGGSMVDDLDAALPEPDAAPLPPPDHITSCDDAESPGLMYEPHGCAYPVSHPAGLEHVAPSCGDPGADTSIDGLHITFAGSDPSREVAISWFTGPSNRVSEIRLGTDPDNLDRIYRGHAFTYGAINGRFVHEVHLCDLRPGTTYYYEAGGQGAWSDTNSFTTAPPVDSEEEIIFAITGDSRSNTGRYEQWNQALAEMDRHGADVLLFSGDAVDLGLVQAQWDGWFRDGQPYMASLPIIPANGNHDQIVLQWLAQFALPYSEDHNEENFAYRYGNTLIITLTDQPIHDISAIRKRTRDFLEETLENNQDATWKFVVNHRPFFSASTRHGSTEVLQAEWLPLLDRYQVDMVFNGHDHNYERSRPIRDGQVVSRGEGTIFVVAAGVGAPLYDNGSQWWTSKSEKVPSYVILRVAGDRLEFNAYRLDGTGLDEFVWEK